MKFLGTVNLKPYVFISFATASAVANLANSAGCNLTGPKTSHEWEPFMFGARKIVAISNTMTPAYIR